MHGLTHAEFDSLMEDADDYPNGFMNAEPDGIMPGGGPANPEAYPPSDDPVVGDLTNFGPHQLPVADGEVGTGAGSGGEAGSRDGAGPSGASGGV